MKVILVNDEGDATILLRDEMKMLITEVEDAKVKAKSMKNGKCYWDLSSLLGKLRLVSGIED